jgi:hypothetical protein
MWERKTSKGVLNKDLIQLAESVRRMALVDNGNESSGSIKAGAYLRQLSDY